MPDKDKAQTEPTDEQRAQAAMDAAAEAEENRADETVPGGRYMVGGQMVNANGEPVKAEK